MSTLTSVRQQMGKELAGTEIAFTANASGNSTTTLVDTDQSYITQSTDLHVDHYIYAPGASAANRLRLVSAFTASSGTFTVTPAVSGGTVYDSIAFEIHAYLDPVNQVPRLINEALKRIPLAVTVNFAPVANNWEQDLTAQQSWLTNRQWVRGARLLADGGDQQQTITEAGSPSGGTFTLTYRGTASGNIAYDVTAASLQTTLRALHADLASVTVTRTGTSTNFVWVVTMTGADDYVPIFTADASSLTGGSSPTITPSITRDRGQFVHLPCKAVKRSASVYLQTERTFQTTDRIYVDTIKPAYYHCKTASGNYGGQSGLSAETDVCIPDENLVTFAALTILARGETNTISRAAQSAIAVQGPRWSKTFAALLQEWWDTQVDAELLAEPVYWFGPGPSGPMRARPSWAR